MASVLTQNPSPWHNTESFSWTGILADETTTALRASGRPDKTLVVSGVFNAASLAVQGSNDPADPPAAGSWVAVHDLAGDPVVFTVANSVTFQENPYHLRLVNTGGNGSTLLNAQLTVR